ncbi:uncharacterized protein LOC101863927 isoform X1 [Aplysia californica]|uniref:Uncharacterized protein LOC101863927 isoform X1 n=1 Tax=Aplysia californica TaxID=6500 RepID=A0ABM1VZ58_APLCA|nr:uncharacterized protein LOC101863927 isoform X1 [Aplysia californica]XP_005106133.1 uncharacterized protein LOC101863927 isoform X1 [Aplysia californica]XP_035827701.1 uncharacterized protein LOC101863927 isoform X1 [Aplysia californica]
MSNFRTLVHPPAVDTPTRLEQRPPISQSGGSFLATQKGWPPYMPGYFGPYSLPPRKPSAILDLRDKRYGKEARVGNPRWAEGSWPLPYHTLYFDPQTEGDWKHFERFMPPGQMVRRRWPQEPLEEIRFPERGLADPSHLNRKNYRGYHFLPNYSRRYVVGDPRAPWNKAGDFTYTSWSTVLQQADF